MTQICPSKRLISLAFAAFLCCCISPLLPSNAFAQNVPHIGGGKGVYASNTVATDDSAPIPVTSSGLSRTSGVCVFEENPELYDTWGTATVMGKQANDIADAEDQAESSLPLVMTATLRAIREPREPSSTNDKDKGCPAFEVKSADGFYSYVTPLKQCGDFYQKVALLPNTDPNRIQNGSDDVFDLTQLDPNIACCHLERGAERQKCKGQIIAASSWLRAKVLVKGASVSIPVQGMSPDQRKAIDERKTKKRNAVQQCWDKHFDSVKKYFIASKIKTCVATVKEYFSAEMKKQRKELRSRAKKAGFKALGNTHTPTVGMSNGLGNSVTSPIGKGAEAVESLSYIAVVAKQIAQGLDTMLNKCGNITKDFDALDNLIKNVTNQACEATLGLIDRQLTQCIRVNFGGDLRLPHFNLLVQCPVRFSLDMRISPSGVTCVRNVVGQNAVPGFGIGSYSGSGPSFLNAAGAVESIFNGNSNCFSFAKVGTKDGKQEKFVGGILQNPLKMSSPRLPSVDCGPLDESVTKVVNGLTYLPPGPAPAATTNNASGRAWVVSPVKDTGFVPATPTAFDNMVSRCDLYDKGRIIRTAYVFGDGAACTDGAAPTFLNAGKEIVTSCYPGGGYKPVNKSPIPEACFYRQGTPQPCLLEDLSGLDPAKLAAQGSGGTTALTLTSIPVTLANNGQLMSIVNPASAQTLLQNGAVLTQGNLLTNASVANFAPPALTTAPVMTNNGLSVVQPNQPGQIGGNLGVVTNNNVAQQAQIGQLVAQGQPIDLAVSQTGCARAFATHDSVGGALRERMYPIANDQSGTGGFNATPSAPGTLTLGSCSEFSQTQVDPICCDPQVQDCRKPPQNAYPICACDQGDKFARAIEAKDANGQTIMAKDDQGNVIQPPRPSYVCVDKDNKLIPGATKTCCDAKLNGEGAQGCGSPAGVTPQISGAMQARALAQVDGFDFKTDNPLPRCEDEAAMCVKKDTLKDVLKPDPYNYLLVRPDSTITMINGKSKQCCTTPMCNVCPQAYAGAYGLALRDTLPQSTAYIAAGKPSDSDAFTALTQIPQTQADAEFKWNMQLFRDGWPYATVTRDDNSQVLYTGRGAWVGLLSQFANDPGLDGNWLKIWSLLAMRQDDHSNPLTHDYFGGNCNDDNGRPCAFPNFTINKSFPAVPADMFKLCADAAQGGAYSSWEIFRDNMRSGNPQNVSGVEGTYLHNFLNNFQQGNQSAQYIPYLFRANPPKGPIYVGGDYKGNFRLFGDEKMRRTYTYVDSINSGVMGMKLGYDDYATVPDPQMMPIDYLNMMRAKLAIPGQEYDELKLCSDAAPLCVDPALEQYADAGGNTNVTNSTIVSGLNDYGDNAGGSGSDNTGNDPSGQCTGLTGAVLQYCQENGIPPQCIGLTGSALQQCISQVIDSGSCAGMTGTALQQCIMDSTIPAQCQGITDPTAFAQCLAANGINVPAQCQGLVGQAMAQCLWNYNNQNGVGGLGAGGLRQGGIRIGNLGSGLGGDNNGGSTTPATGTGSIPTTTAPAASGSLNSSVGSGSFAPVVRPGTGSGTGIPVAPRAGMPSSSSSVGNGSNTGVSNGGSASINTGSTANSVSQGSLSAGSAGGGANAAGNNTSARRAAATGQQTGTVAAGQRPNTSNVQGAPSASATGGKPAGTAPSTTNVNGSVSRVGPTATGALF